MDAPSFNHSARLEKIAARHIAHRLKSIAADAQRVNTVLAGLQSGDGPKMPIFANLRCGAWYVPQATGTAYFKSTDGHYGKWALSLTRLNLHLVADSLQATGFVLVDATQHGKRFPDALSKTVPLWCRVLNAAAVAAGDPGVRAENVPAGAAAFPPWIAPSEVAAMEDLVPLFATRLAETGLRPVLRRPLRCHWIAANDRDAEAQGRAFGSNNLHLAAATAASAGKATHPEMATTPVLLLSASGDADGPRASRGGWTYIPGAGDDHTTWARGLDAATFWRHAAHLTDPLASLLEVERRVSAVVAAPMEATRDISQDNDDDEVAGASEAKAVRHGAVMTVERVSCGTGGAPGASAVRRVGSLPLVVLLGPDARRAAEAVMAAMPLQSGRGAGGMIEVVPLRGRDICAASSPAVAEQHAPGRSSERRVVLAVDDGGNKHGIERSLHKVLTFAAEAWGVQRNPCGEESSGAPEASSLSGEETIMARGRDIAILCPNDPSLASLVAIAICAAFCRRERVPEGVSTGTGVVVDTHWSESTVDKEQLQWAHRFVVASVDGGCFPSRSHMKQVSRYFLTPKTFGRNESY